MQAIKDLFNHTPKSNTIGLCLSGGGALGFAHIGVIQALEENKIYPTFITGSSMGAIIGTFYAAGYSSQSLLQLIKEDKLYKITKLMSFPRTFLNSGLSKHEMLGSLIRELIPHNSFEQLKLKMNVCVVNLNAATWEIKNSGNELDKWVCASASIPGLFETIKVDSINYTDGGLLNNMPAQAISEQCDVIIGVDVIPHLVPTKLKKPIDTLAFSVRAMQHQNSKEGRNLCKFLIEPQSIKKFHEFSFDSFQAIYQHGYDAANQYIAANKDILQLATP